MSKMKYKKQKMSKKISDEHDQPMTLIYDVNQNMILH